jgi:hypothetical protein
MNADKEYYLNWRYARDVTPTQPTARPHHKSIEASPDASGVPKDPKKEARVKELMTRTQKLFERSTSLHNPDKVQVGIFYDSDAHDGMTQDDRQEIERLSHASDPIFYPMTYSSVRTRQEEDKATHYRTLTKTEHGEEQFCGDLPAQEHNLRRTVISEYSNAIHNGTVFINPRFMSC